MSELNRREFVVVAAVAAGASVSLTCLNDEAFGDEAAAAKAETTVDVGTAADYAADGVSDAFAKSNKIFVVRKDNRLYATSGICTHKKCALKFRDGLLACPCHRSKFNDEGIVDGGPAKNPLPRHGISTNDQERIIVDKSRSFDQPNWNDPGAFIELA